MADRFWVGGGSSTNWNATANTNWAATSGGANNASVPTTGDAVIFDANSGSGVSVINASVSLAKMDAQGFAGTLTHNTAVTITITGAAVDSLRLPLTGTYGPGGTTALFTLTSTTGTTDITSNGKRFGALTLNGTGGTFRLLDALRVDAFQNSTLTLTTGIFNANNFTVTIQALSSSNSNTRTITMGSGAWTVGGNVSNGTTIWNLNTTTGLTFNKNTANVTVPTNNLSGSRVWNGGNLTYNDLTIASNSAKGVVLFGTPGSYTNLTIGAGLTIGVTSAQTLTCTGTFSFSGTSSLHVGLVSSTLGSTGTLTISSGTIVIDYGAFRDLIVTGSANVSATNSLDLGNNTGISISAPVTTSYPTASEIAAAVWDEPTAGNITAGTFGAQLKTVVDTIDAKTANLPSDPADASVIAGRFDTLDTTLAGTLLADIRKVNNIAVSGSGTEVDPWGP